jgi:CTP synthase
VIEYARNVAGLADAHSTEMNKKAKHAVIDIMHSQKSIKTMGGTMRLGAYDCTIAEKTLAHKLYKSKKISERHRHRYEFNNDYLDILRSHGLVTSGINTENNLVEIIELQDHPFFIGAQYHPELKSTPENPHPLFVGLIEAAVKWKK